MCQRAVFAVVVVAAMLMGTAVRAASTSELLEKGIYTEETVGDLDGAISIYKKVVAEGKASHALAAQAQYRLGQCLLKKGKKDEATAAFKKLISDFADQKELVAKAKKYVPGQEELVLGSVPWENGEFMQLALKSGLMRLGAMVWAVESAKLDEKDVCRTTLHRYVGEAASGVSHVESDPTTSRPIKSVFRNGMLGYAEAEYLPGEVVVTTKDAKGNKVVRKDKLDKVYYDQEQACQILRRLPLAEGYKGVLPLYIPVGGQKLGLAFEVAGKETIEVPAGKFECYKVPLRDDQPNLVVHDRRQPLPRAIGGRRRRHAELEQIGLNRPGEMRTCKDDQMGCSFSVPAGWYFYETSTGDGPKNYILLDPEELAINFVGVWRMTKDDGKRPSRTPRKPFALLPKRALPERAKELKDYKVRPDSWKEFTVGGLPAVSVIGDYTAVQYKKSDYSVHVLGKTTKAQLRISQCDPDKIDGLAVEFDKIVESLKVK